MHNEIRLAANGQSIDLSSEESRREWAEFFTVAGMHDLSLCVPAFGNVLMRGPIEFRNTHESHRRGRP